MSANHLLAYHHSEITIIIPVLIVTRYHLDVDQVSATLASLFQPYCAFGHRTHMGCSLGFFYASFTESVNATLATLTKDKRMNPSPDDIN